MQGAREGGRESVERAASGRRVTSPVSSGRIVQELWIHAKS